MRLHILKEGMIMWCLCGKEIYDLDKRIKREDVQKHPPSDYCKVCLKKLIH